MVHQVAAFADNQRASEQKQVKVIKTHPAAAVVGPACPAWGLPVPSMPKAPLALSLALEEG